MCRLLFDAVGLLYAVKIVAIFYTVQYEHTKRDVVVCAFVCFKFPGVCFCQELAKKWMTLD